MSEVPTGPQSSGLAPNIAGALAYLLGPITGVLFLVIEKHNPFVRFHAAQSIAVSVVFIVAWIALTILSAILGVIPILGWLIGILLSLGFGVFSFIFWLFLMYQAFQGNEWEVPVVADQARRHLLSAPPSA